MFAAMKRFLNAPITRKMLLVEAAVILLLARLLTLFPMRIHMKVCGHRQRETPPVLPPAQLETAMKVGSAVHRAASVVPFKAVCIEQTVAASFMLRIRGVPTTTYVGVHLDPGKRKADPQGFNAHAWLRAGEKVVIGGPDVSDYVPLATFA